MPKLKLINFNRGKASIILPLLGFVLILGSLAAAEFWLHKADVNVLFADYQTEKQTDIKSLPVAIATVSAQLSDSQTATGKRDVGDSARGEVTVYSFDDKEKTIDKGTILEVNGLQFIFDEDIKIPPFTENNDVRVPGKTQGKITASAIGPESNLKKDQIFKIADLDQKDFYAKNAGDLTGGTKKEIRTVAQKDLDQLEKTLLKKGEASIKAKGTSLPKGERAIDSLTKYDIAEIKFSKEIGEEATKVEGNGLIEAQYVVFNEEELLNLINKEIKTDIPAGYTVKPENINYEFDKVEETGDTVEATVTIKIKAMRDLDEKEVTEKVKGKNRQAIEKIFSQEYKARGVEMTVKPAIPFLKDWLPLIGNNIVLKISSI